MLDNFIKKIIKLSKKFFKKINGSSTTESSKKNAKNNNILTSPLYTSFPENNPSAQSILQCCIAYNQAGGYCIPLRSSYRPAAQTVFAGKVWEPETIEYMSAKCGSGDIVHAGTYFGDFLPLLSKAIDRKAKIWAFEPNPENFQCAQITILINNLTSVILTNAGLGSQPGTLPMMVSDATGMYLGGSSKLVQASELENPNQYVEVKVVKIDDVIPADRNVSILQLDVEGFEQEALAGALQTINRCQPILILETLPDTNWLNEHLYSIGYKFTKKVHNNSVFEYSKI